MVVTDLLRQPPQFSKVRGEGGRGEKEGEVEEGGQ